MALDFEPVLVADLASNRVNGEPLHVCLEQSCTSISDRLEEVPFQVLCVGENMDF